MLSESVELAAYSHNAHSSPAAISDTKPTNGPLEALIGNVYLDRIQLLWELLAVYATTKSPNPHHHDKKQQLEHPKHAFSDISVQVAVLEAQAAQLKVFLDSEITFLQRGRAETLAKLKLQESVLVRILDRVPAESLLQNPPTHYPSSYDTVSGSAYSSTNNHPLCSDTNVDDARGGASQDHGNSGHTGLHQSQDHPASHKGIEDITSESHEQQKSGKPSKKIQVLSDLEYSRIPQYIVGRITRERINQAIEDLNLLISDKYKILRMPQPKMSKLQRTIYYEHKQLATPETKLHVFITEKDLKDKAGGWTESGFKFDAVGRNVIAILRHLGRIREVRGGGHTRIVLL
ncbi:hypothetical protein BASA61_001892 [Batrachochytrium salamandrivorans]|nr:hypothetical protein BASA61_001892 [Batrachochytrium salamandrivorans]KAH9273086.1 hypothetical protein BASA83_004663 [Batrachochytrium salamandrivorans]